MKKKMNLFGVLAGVVLLCTFALSAMISFGRAFFDYYEYSGFLIRLVDSLYYAMPEMTLLLLGVSMFTKSRNLLLGTYAGYCTVEMFYIILQELVTKDGRYYTQDIGYYAVSKSTNIITVLPDLVRLTGLALLFVVMAYFVYESMTDRVKKTPMLMRVLAFLPIVLLFAYKPFGAIVAILLDAMGQRWHFGYSFFAYWAELGSYSALDTLYSLLADLCTLLLNVGLALGVVACFKNAPKELPVEETVAE